MSLGRARELHGVLFWGEVVQLLTSPHSPQPPSVQSALMLELPTPLPDGYHTFKDLTVFLVIFAPTLRISNLQVGQVGIIVLDSQDFSNWLKTIELFD